MPRSPTGNGCAVLNGSDDRPLVGLTTYRQQARSGVWDVQASFLHGVYLDGVTQVGGVAVLLPPQPVDAAIAARVIDGLDALVLTGGADIDPARYGDDPHPEAGAPAPVRDAWEFALLEAALERGMPVLGICRGAQVLNVALGGTLHQHLPDVLGHTGHQPAPAVYSTSTVTVVPGTRLAALVGESIEAQCYHHQAIDRLGEGLMVAGVDRDGVIEAVEMPDRAFVLAVQWHPEQTLDDSRLFAGVADAARHYLREKVS